MLDFNWSLKELSCWTKSFEIKERLDNFGQPHPGIWPENSDDFKKLVQDICSSLDRDHLLYFHALILSSALLDRSRVPVVVWEWLEQNVNLSSLGLPFDWPELKHWQWGRINLVLAVQGSARIIYALIGHGQSEIETLWPLWAEKRMDTRAKQSIKRVCSLLHPEKPFFFWPQINPTGQNKPINGASIGLPVYLGFKALKQQKKIPEQVVCTGKINNHGILEAVSFVEEKVHEAKFKCFAAFIYPQDSIQFRPYGPSLEILPVPDLETAWLIFDHYSSDCGRQALDFLLHANDPQWMARNIAHVSLPLLMRVEKEYSFAPVLAGIIKDKDLLLTLINSLEYLVVRPDWPKKKIEMILDMLFPWSRIQDIAAEFPELSFRICQLHLKKASQTGDLAAGKLWSDRANLFTSSVIPLDESEKHLLVSRLNELVSQTHNRYCFQPGLPPQIGEREREIIEEMEASLARRKKREPLAVHVSLGQFYGTMAQHFAFCGPEYLQKVEEYVHKACAAFGLGQVPAYRQEWQREYSYLVYAYLDAGEPDKALSALQIYLGGNIRDYTPDNNPYKHAALMRFLADTGFDLSHYLKWARHKARNIPHQHPWQLWAYNLGQVTQDRKLKRKFWQQAVQLCLRSGEAAINVMALLPLSKLYAHKLSSSEYLSLETSKVLEILNNSSLYKPHFARILEAETWEETLEIVFKYLPGFFPFSYR
jgi:hypothetical protein